MGTIQGEVEGVHKAIRKEDQGDSGAVGVASVGPHWSKLNKQTANKAAALTNSRKTKTMQEKKSDHSLLLVSQWMAFT